MLTDRVQTHADERPRHSADASARLNGLECALLSHEARYRTGNLSVGAMGRVEGRPPTLEDFREALRPGLRARSRLRLAVSTEDTGSWRHVAELDVHGHVRQWVCPTGTELRTAVEQIMSARLRTDRPLWEVWLIRGYSRDEWAVVFKAHHALLDGASVVQVLAELFDTGGDVHIPAQRGKHHLPEEEPPRQVRGSLRRLGRYFPLARRAFTCAEGSGERRFHWAQVDRSRLERAAARHGVSVDDVFLAALTTAVREWRHTPWDRGTPRPVWTLFGNRIAPPRVQLPCHDPDPVRRLDTIAKATQGIGDEPVSSEASSPWLATRAVATSFSTRHAALIASAVHGPEWEPGFHGARMRELVPLGPLPVGHWLGAYLVTHADRAGVGFVLDPSVRNGAELCRLWSLAFAELDGPLERLC
ncbi:wax ester/triacylglycerol synthase domain-containing protein [Allokutzneria oryzae]|uniref:diacylglycerol O-acyltransferase n=1 Tax=Allokutzneria oryzae TaxID=1378989 RepID=A0ABV5ZZ95_9PSEU